MNGMAEHAKAGAGATALFLRVAAAVVLCLVLAGCPWDDARENPKTDLSLAEEALKERDTGDAEMYFQRYLRKNPDGVERWKVWQNLLDLCLNIRQDKATAREYLEIMLVEFSADGKKRRAIQQQLAGLCDEARDHARAASLWEALAADPGTDDETKAATYRRLSQAYLRRLEFSAATDVLEMCLKLSVSGATKADCLYSLGEVQMLTENLSPAQKALEASIATAGVTPRRRVLATFMLADVLEQQERYDEARALFESIRSEYPNEKVIEQRILYLKDKKSKASAKPDVQVPPRFNRP